ncbi:MAG TPA: hypothetical protein VFJ61_03525 [Solirubrobacterales bacterium]|nr:hypothetical protein [Solirubrobacterales bacterium]
MKLLLALGLLCLASVPLACGGDESATGADKGTKSAREQAESGTDSPGKTWSVKTKAPKIGSYPHVGPFAAISGGEGNERPTIDPADGPPPRKPLVRDLRRGFGPPAQLGDRITIYYAGAPYKTGKVQYYGWPPAPPTSFKLGGGIAIRLYELGFQGLRTGGLREVILPPGFYGKGSEALDYVMVLMKLKPASTKR